MTFKEHGMTKTKKFAASVALACAAFTTHAVYAADVSNTPSAVEITDGAGFFGRLITDVTAGDTFADHYTFTLASPTDFTADLFSYSPAPGTGLDITGLDLYRSDGTLVLNGTQIMNDGIQQWQLTTTGLSAASYYVQVSGNVMSQPGIYSGSVAEVAAVPEPATYGMLLGGLALVGAVARRRKS
jgi:hypothetical protein